jgi:hypothetical protein
LGAALLLVAPLAGAQASQSGDSGSSLSGGSCVIAGPSYGACSALGRYAQGFKDVEGGVKANSPAVGRQTDASGAPLHADAATSPSSGQVGSTRVP